MSDRIADLESRIASLEHLVELLVIQLSISSPSQQAFRLSYSNHAHVFSTPDGGIAGQMTFTPVRDRALLAGAEATGP